MQAVIFAAGRGTRMGEIARDRPKPLIEVSGASILERALGAMPASVRDIIIVVGHLQDAVRKAPFLAGRSGIRFAEQPELSGTYDALMAAKPFLGEDPFLVLNGDDLYGKEDLEALAAAEPFAILAKRVPRPNRYSHLETEDGRLVRIVPNRELPDEMVRPETMTYTGAALLDRSFFDLAPAAIPASHDVPGAGAERSLPHTLQAHLNKRPVRVVEGVLWLPVGTPEELAEAERALSS